MANIRGCICGITAILLACSQPEADNAAAVQASRKLLAHEAQFSEAAMFRILGGTETTGIVKSLAIWRVKSVPVCWESPGPEESNGRRWTQDAVEGSWESNAGIDFTGWLPCRRGDPGIHIWTSAEYARTFGLGNELNGKSRPDGGMRLNFSMTRWNEDCRDRFGLEKCIRIVAVHEFGHALGLAHEQNRDETADIAGEDCAKRAAGSRGDRPLTPWDPESVMNYCNPVYGNDGQLSEKDISSAQQVYGLPER